MNGLACATALIEDAECRARLRADPDAADRLARLARAVAYEAQYDANVTRGLAIVRRRDDVPEGATVGWFLRYDAAVVAARRLTFGPSKP